MSDYRAELIAEMDRYAVAAGIKTTTLGRHLGLGGRFYKRLCEGQRVFPETIANPRVDAPAPAGDSQCATPVGAGSEKPDPPDFGTGAPSRDLEIELFIGCP